MAHSCVTTAVYDAHGVVCEAAGNEVEREPTLERLGLDEELDRRRAHGARHRVPALGPRSEIEGLWIEGEAGVEASVDLVLGHGDNLVETLKRGRHGESEVVRDVSSTLYKACWSTTYHWRRDAVCRWG